jgi:diguanylate cyclase (GGDEF)-like protein
MAYSAALMYGAAAFDGLLAGVIPGDPRTALPELVAAFAVAALILAVGPRLPRWALAPLGPLGVVLIAGSLHSRVGATDGATLYVWPVLWTTYFFGRRGAIAIVLWVGVAHGLVLFSLPAASSYFGRWLDVMISVALVASVVEILARRNSALMSRLADEARIDGLTGLLNRRGFDERATLELADTDRKPQAIAAAAFDIDGFKHINDEWGHQVGDRVLARIGGLLAGRSRGIDIAARMGGDEFVVLLPGSDLPEAHAFTQRIRHALASGEDSGLPAVRVSAGVAVAIAPSNIEPLLHRADQALYAAKRAGRDRTIDSEVENGPPAQDLTGLLS